MASSIKGITIKLGADSSELTTELHKAEQASKDIQRQLTEVNRALKQSPQNAELLRQKEELLKSKIEQTKIAVDKMKEALKQMDAQGVSKTDADYMRLKRNIMAAEAEQKKLTKELANVRLHATGINQAGESMKSLGTKIQGAGQQMAGLSKAAAAVVASLGALAYTGGASADDLNTLSKITGIGTDKLQLYKQAADLVDVDLNTIARSVSRMKKSMGTAADGTGEAAEAFKKLGVNVTDSNGELRDQDVVFQELLASLGSMENETDRDATAMQIFGKSAANLNPLIADMGRTYSNTLEMFKQGGIEIVDQETLDKANEFNDSIDKVKASFSQAFLVLGAKLAETLAPALDRIQQGLTKIAGKISQMNPTVLTVIGIIAAVVASIAPLLMIFGKIYYWVGMGMTAVSRLIPVISSLNLAFLASPVFWVVAGITALVAALVIAYKKSETFRAIVQKVANVLKSILGVVIQDVKRRIELFVSAIKAVVSAIKTAINWVRNLASNIRGALANAFGTVADVGMNIVHGIFQGMSNGLGWIKSQITSWVGNVKSFLKKLFGIHSPSTWARDMIGYNIVAGMAEGLTGNAKMIDKAMSALLPTVTPSLGTMATEMGNAVSAGLAVGNSGATNPQYHVTIELGGTKVAQKIYQLGQQGKLIERG